MGVKPMVQPLVQPLVQTLVQPLVQPIVQPVVQTLVQSLVQPSDQAMEQPVVQLKAQPCVQYLKVKEEPEELKSEIEDIRNNEVEKIDIDERDPLNIKMEEIDEEESKQETRQIFYQTKKDNNGKEELDSGVYFIPIKPK